MSLSRDAWLNRACVDAVREIIGMDPLYRPTGESVGIRSYQLPVASVDMDDNNSMEVVAARYGWFVGQAERRRRRLGGGSRGFIRLNRTETRDD